MKLIKRIGALLITVAMLCSLIVIVPNNVTTVKALEGAGPQGYTTHIYEGCDLSFWNVNDNSYAYGGATDDSGADYSLLDFHAMKADGCDFVILRCGSEDSSGKYIDPHFYTLYNMAREAGLDIGLYYYSYATTYAGAVAEAEFVINAIEDAGMYFEYPIYYDVEESNQLTSSIAPTICKAWCETMIANGYFPGIYGNYSLYDVLTTEIRNTYDLWLAYVSTQTGVSTINPSNENISEDCGMWQYSFYGYGWDGIYLTSSTAGGAVLLDSNVSYKDYPAIMAQYGYNNVSGATTNLSKNSTYYPDANTRTDDYADDGAKLTDGSMGSIYAGETARYSGWFTPELDVVVDLGSSTDSNIYTLYGAINPSWGITDIPSNLTISVSDSLDGPYVEVDSTSVSTVTATDSSTGWSTYTMNITTDPAVTARYVKFTVTAVDAGDTSNPGAGHLWLEETYVAYKASEDEEGGSGGGGATTPTTTVVESIEITTTSAAIAGQALFTPTVLSINGDTSLASSAQSAFLVQWWNEAGTSIYSAGTTFTAGTVYDLYVKFTCNSGFTISDNCVMTLTTSNGTFTGEVYDPYTDSSNYACDFMLTAVAAGTTEPEEEKIISSIEITTTGTAAAGNALFTATLLSINGNTDLISAATSGFSMQWYDETGNTALYASSTNFVEGTVYDLYIKVTRSDDYTFADTVTYTLITPDGTYVGEIYSSGTTSTVHAFDFYVTGLSASGEGGDDEEPVEKLVIESLEFAVNAFDPAVGNTVFTPYLVSVNGDTSLVSYVKEARTLWYTITGSTVSAYTNSTFEALNIGYKYDLYFAITPTANAEFTTDTTLKLTTNSRTHNGTFYLLDTSTGAVSFDIYFQTETVTVPDQSVFITGFNTSIVAGAAQIFTPDFGTVSNSTANVTWTANAIAKYDEELDAYVVTQLIFPTDSGCTVDYTLADDEILVAVHWDDSETDGVTEANRNALMAVQVGMLLEFNNIDLETQTLGSNPTIEFYTLAEPIVSLGAKANETLYGIRFGATYNKVFGYGEVTGLGFLLISEYRLGNNALDLNYALNSEIAEYVVDVEARTIEDYVEGYDFVEYETFTFYVSVVRLDRKGNLDDNIVAVPYITYATGKIVYGAQMKNNFNGVLAGNSSF